MSFFYLSPVIGDMPVHLLEVIILKRMDYLKSISKEESLGYNEYVVEGSIYDNVGHFIVCIMTILCENTSFKQFFLKAETELFKRRIGTLSAYELRSFAKRILQKLKKHEYTSSFTEALLVLCQHLMLKSLTQHICTASHNISCTAYNFYVNYRHCLPFVARRQVELKDGIACIPCGLWKSYLIILFNINLKHRIGKTYLNPLKNDPRIIDLLTKVKTDIFPSINKSYTNEHIVLSNNVNKLSPYFPPCMLNLHQTLRKKHRLSHYQRFYYSLFLKDIGMPVEEALNFWKLEYQQDPNGHHGCRHNWKKDEKKFVYGIRHMYGLEGARKSYASVSCSRIQNVDSACSEGGCPFKSFDDAKICQLLNEKLTNLKITQINEIRRMNSTKACIMYLESNCSNSIDCDISFNFTPINYYIIASKNSSMKL